MEQGRASDRDALAAIAVAGPAKAAPVTEAPAAPEAAPLVLVIDDDPNALDVIARRLRAAGYRVAVEADGGAGIRRAHAERAAVVVCDLHMPLAPGEFVIVALRADPRTAALPIVVVSADPGRLGPEHRVDAVLTKPVAASKLLEVVASLAATSAGGGSGRR